jgi:hypothetical protein
MAQTGPLTLVQEVKEDGGEEHESGSKLFRVGLEGVEDLLDDIDLSHDERVCDMRGMMRLWDEVECGLILFGDGSKAIRAEGCARGGDLDD